MSPVFIQIHVLISIISLFIPFISGQLEKILSLSEAKSLGDSIKSYKIDFFKRVSYIAR